MAEDWTRKLPGENRLIDLYIPITAGDWELFVDMPGVGRAAKRMTGALKRSIKRFDSLRRSTHSDPVLALYAAYTQVMAETMNKFSDFGATDTEPRNVAQGHLARYAVAVLGGDVYDYDF